jgi:hypothetical protein
MDLSTLVLRDFVISWASGIDQVKTLEPDSLEPCISANNED